MSPGKTRFRGLSEKCEAGLTRAEDDGRQNDQSESWVAIVEDDPSLRAALARALRGNSIRAEAFASAEEFLRRFVSDEPDCIVLDIHLGGMSGLELQALLGSIRSDPAIIFITGHDDLLSQRAQYHGASGYLRKPFDTNTLIDLIRPHLRAPALD